MTLAVLNELDICMADIGNAYLTAPITEKCYIVAGDEFGPDLKGRTLKMCGHFMVLNLLVLHFGRTLPRSSVSC